MDTSAKPEYLAPTRREMAHRADARSLNTRIAVVAAVVMAELWALTAAIEAWAEGQLAVLGWIVGFQLACFLLALSIASATPSQMRLHRDLAAHGTASVLSAE